jgi:methylaspartate ammonia-lyase
MTSATTTAERELGRELNPLWHVRQLFEKHNARVGRGPRARELGVPEHLVNRVFARADRTYQGIPKHDTLGKIAHVIGCDPNVLLLAFIKDLQPAAKSCIEDIQAIIDPVVDMTDSQRKALVELAKALTKMTQGQGRDVVRYAKRVISDAR